jgi:Mn2+/Fe2+ NRAMP family transporter
VHHDDHGGNAECTCHTDIQTSAQAAEALRPLAGRFAFTLFARRWPVGLARAPHRAKAFYGTIAAATVAGALIKLSPLDPVKALFWSAVVNGVVAVPVMAMTMVLGTKCDVMGEFTISRPLKLVGWIATAVMLAAALGIFAT